MTKSAACVIENVVLNVDGPLAGTISYTYCSLIDKEGVVVDSNFLCGRANYRMQNSNSPPMKGIDEGVVVYITT